MVAIEREREKNSFAVVPAGQSIPQIHSQSTGRHYSSRDSIVTMSARKNPNRVYTATADELNEAIGLVLKEVRRRGRTAERDEVIDSDR